MNKKSGLVGLCFLIIMTVGCTQSHLVRSRVIETELGIKMELADIDFSEGQNKKDRSIQRSTSSNVVEENGLLFNQSFVIRIPCGGYIGTWGFLLNNGELTDTPVLQVNGKTGGQRAMDFVAGASTGAGIAAAGALIRPSRNTFNGGSNNVSATGTGGNTSSTSSSISN